MSVYPTITIDGTGISDYNTDTLIDGDGDVNIHAAYNEDGDAATHTCARCGADLNDDDESDDDGALCPENVQDWDEDNGVEINGPHDPAPVPLAWCNSASINADTDNNTIRVSISVGDSRGAFSMQVEQLTYIDDDGQQYTELRLSVPTPESAMLHAPLTQLASEGYYRIGERTKTN